MLKCPCCNFSLIEIENNVSALLREIRNLRDISYPDDERLSFSVKDGVISYFREDTSKWFRNIDDVQKLCDNESSKPSSG